MQLVDTVYDRGFGEVLAAAQFLQDTGFLVFAFEFFEGSFDVFYGSFGANASRSRDTVPAVRPLPLIKYVALSNLRCRSNLLSIA